MTISPTQAPSSCLCQYLQKYFFAVAIDLGRIGSPWRTLAGSPPPPPPTPPLVFAHSRDKLPPLSPTNPASLPLVIPLRRRPLYPLDRRSLRSLPAYELCVANWFVPLPFSFFCKFPPGPFQRPVRYLLRRSTLLAS